MNKLMSKQLYLLRHGEAEQSPYQSDFQRKLTERGANKLRSLGIEMKQKSFFPEKVYCSTAVRTRETAQAFLEQLGYDGPVDYQDEIYEASVRTLFELVCKTDNAISSLLIIGHNPGISYLFDYLTKKNFIGMTPGELVGVTFDSENWSELHKGQGTRIRIGL